MTLTITPGKLAGRVTPPPSKSQAHRLLIAAALAEGESRIANVALSQDIAATLRCLEELGASFRREGEDLVVEGMGAGPMSPLRRLAHPRLDCGESGSTLRFLIPVALAVRAGGVFTGRGRLMERPLGPYFDLFDQKGIFYARREGVLTLSGGLEGGLYTLPGNVSSQFFTGLLFALPLREGDSTLVSATPLESAAYLDMTLQALARFGVAVEREGDAFRIPGGQRYRPADCAVEGDWSNAAFWYAAAFLDSSLDIRGLESPSAQGDAAIARLYWTLARPGEAEIDLSQCPDLAPPLAAMAALRGEGRVTRLVNAGRLRMKESDRLSAIAAAIAALGGAVEEGADCLTITGREELPGGGVVDCRSDHRIAMMAAVAATCCRAPVTLEGAECVAKSYPDFWEEYARLGGSISPSGGGEG